MAGTKSEPHPSVHVADDAGPSKLMRMVRMIWAMLECLLFGGLVYGWHSLVFVLKEEGFYAELCDDNATTSAVKVATTSSNDSYDVIGKNDTLLDAAHGLLAEIGCSEQDSRMNLVFTISVTIMTVSTLPMGHLQLKLGTRILRAINAVLLIAGGLIIAFMTTAVPWLIFIGLTCISVGGLQVLITNIQVANLFVAGAGTVVGFMAGAYDSSAFMQYIVKLCYESGISRKYSYIVITCLFGLFVISTALFFPKTFIQKALPKKSQHLQDMELEVKEALVDGPESGDGPSLKTCILAPVYLLHVFWLSILQLKFYYYLGSLNTWLGILTHDDVNRVSYYTNLSLYIQLGGLLMSPLSGIVLDLERRRHSRKPTMLQRRLQPAALPLAFTTVVVLIFSGLTLVSHEEVLYAVFVVAVIFRSFMYGLLAAFIQMIFPAQFFGFLYGVVMVVSGIFATLQYPLFLWLEAPPKGPFKVNMLLTVLMVISFAHPIYIWYICRKSGQHCVKYAKDDSKNQYKFLQ